MAPTAPPQWSHKCRRRHSGMSPGSPPGSDDRVSVAAESLGAPDSSFLSVHPSKPAWLWDDLPFFDPSIDASWTDAKSLTCADSKGLWTDGRIEISESVREAIWPGQ